jgi:hypothetical protein
MAALVKTIGLFVVAAVCEIGGAYLIWLWRNNNKPVWLALGGLLALFGYAFIQMTKGKIPNPNDQPPATTFGQPPTTNYQPLASVHHPPSSWRTTPAADETTCGCD